MPKYVFTVDMRLRLDRGSVAAIKTAIAREVKGIAAPIDVRVAPGSKRAVTSVVKDIKGVGTEATATARHLRRLGSEIGSYFGRFTAFTLATGVIFGTYRRIKEAADQAIEFDRELNRISQISGKTRIQLSGLTNEVFKLSTDLGVGSDNLIVAARTLVQAGYSADKAKRSLEALAKTELSPTFNDMADTTEGLIAILSQFPEQSDRIEQSLSALNAVAAAFPVESADLITAVRKAGGAFSVTGGKLEELLALFTAVRGTTRESADTIGTGLRTIFSRLQKKSTFDILERLGVRGLRDEVTKEFVGSYQALRSIAEQYSRLSPASQQAAQIIETIGGVRQTAKIVPILRDFSKAEAALSVAYAGSNSLAENAAVAQDALTVQYKKTSESLSEFINTLAQNKDIRDFITNVLKLTTSLVKLATALSDLVPYFAVLGVATAARFAKPIAAGIFTRRPLGAATGGTVPGSGTGDIIPAMLEPEEFVVRRSIVKKMGRPFMEALNRGDIQKLSEGGMVGKDKALLLRNQQLDKIDADFRAGRLDEAQAANLRHKVLSVYQASAGTQPTTARQKKDQEYALKHWSKMPRKLMEDIQEVMREEVHKRANDPTYSKIGGFVNPSGMTEENRSRLSAVRQIAEQEGYSVGDFTRHSDIADAPISRPKTPITSGAATGVSPVSGGAAAKIPKLGGAATGVSSIPGVSPETYAELSKLYDSTGKIKPGSSASISDVTKALESMPEKLFSAKAAALGPEIKEVERTPVTAPKGGYSEKSRRRDIESSDAIASALAIGELEAAERKLPKSRRGPKSGPTLSELLGESDYATPGSLGSLGLSPESRKKLEADPSERLRSGVFGSSAGFGAEITPLLAETDDAGSAYARALKAREQQLYQEMKAAGVTEATAKTLATKRAAAAMEEEAAALGASTSALKRFAKSTGRGIKSAFTYGKPLLSKEFMGSKTGESLKTGLKAFGLGSALALAGSPAVGDVLGGALGDKQGSVVQKGLAGGATAGLSASLLGLGPFGVAVAGVTAGLYSMYKAAGEYEKALNAKAISDALQAFTDAVDEATRSKALKELAGATTKERRRIAEEATGGGNTFINALKQQTSNIGRSLFGTTQSLKGQSRLSVAFNTRDTASGIQAEARKQEQEQLAELYRPQAAAMKEQAQKLIKSGRVESLDDLEKVIPGFIDALDYAEEGALNNGEALRQQYSAMVDMAVATEQAIVAQRQYATELSLISLGEHDFARRIRDLIPEMAGDLGASAQVRGFSGLESLGTARFAQDVNRMGGLGGDRQAQLLEINRLSSVLPRVISEGLKSGSISLGGFTGVEGADQSLATALGQMGFSDYIVDAVQKSIASSDKFSSDKIRETFQDVNQVVATVEDTFKSVVDSAKDVGGALTELRSALLVETQTFLARSQSVGQSRDTANQAALTYSRQLREFSGLPTVAGMDERMVRGSIRSDLDRMGMTGVTPDASGLGSALFRTDRAYQQSVARGEPDERIKEVSNRLVEHLSRLGDASARTGDLMQRLSEVEASRASKISAAEKFFTGSRSERRNMQRSINVAKEFAASGGNLSDLPDRMQKMIIAGFRDIGDVRLAETGGLTGNKFLENVLARESGGLGLGPSDESVRTSLQNSILNAQLEAAKAQSTLADRQEAIFNNFIGSMSQANREFLDGLRGAFSGGGGGGDLALLPTMSDSLLAFNTEFGSHIDQLAEAAKNIPSTIEMNASHKIEVVFNGAQMLAELQPTLQAMAVSAANESLSRFVRTNMPDINLPQQV